MKPVPVSAHTDSTDLFSGDSRFFQYLADNFAVILPYVFPAAFRKSLSGLFRAFVGFSRNGDFVAFPVI